MLKAQQCNIKCPSTFDEHNIEQILAKSRSLSDHEAKISSKLFLLKLNEDNNSVSLEKVPTLADCEFESIVHYCLTFYANQSLIY